MEKLELVYRKLLPLKVVSFDEVVEITMEVTQSKKRQYIYRRYVKKLVDEGKLDRVRKGLYTVLSPLESPENPDRFLIGSKVRKNYYLGYHTALEFYGSAYSWFNEVYVSVEKKNRFNTFQYRDLKFRPVFVKDANYDVREKDYQGTKIRVSSKERTFVDCLDRVDYAGGWEEVLKSLQGLGGVNFDTLFRNLLFYENDLLFRKAGLVLDLLRESSVFYEHITDKMLNDLHKKISEKPRYLCGKSGDFNERWRLYIPQNFNEKLRGI